MSVSDIFRNDQIRKADSMAALSLLLLSAAVTDLRYSRICNVQIVLAFAAGVAANAYRDSPAGFIARTVCTAAALYFSFISEHSEPVM